MLRDIQGQIDKEHRWIAREFSSIPLMVVNKTSQAKEAEVKF